MKTRIITGTVLALVLIFAVYFGGYVFSVLFVASMGLCVYEIYRALRVKGLLCSEWPVWLSMAISIPLFMEIKTSITLILSIVAGAILMITVMIMTRPQPRLDDLLASCLPLIAVLLPGMCMLGLNKLADRAIQVPMIILAFGVPLFGDMIAYFLGKRFGKRKLCPVVSPNKTVEGAVAGLVGSVLFSLLIWIAVKNVITQDQMIFPLWNYLLVGLIGGIAGQAGDLFASMIKRYCEVKDYGSIFPGHGGMMDRLDSTYWATVVIYIFINCAMPGLQ